MNSRMITQTNENYPLVQNSRLESTYSPKIHICIQSIYHPHDYNDSSAEVHMMLIRRNSITKLSAACLEDERRVLK